MRTAHNKTKPETKPETEQKVISLYLALHSPKDIVAQLGVSSSTIDQILRQRGIPRHFKTAFASGMTEKRCRDCKTVKPASEFPKAGAHVKHCKISAKGKKCTLKVSNGWRDENRELVRKGNRIRAKIDRATNPQYKVAQNLRRRIRLAILKDGAIKSDATIALLGCSVESFIQHLESQFKPGMAWENYGPIWHIDHIKPCAKFDLTHPEQQRICFHWSNQQPLWASENMSKGSR